MKNDGTAKDGRPRFAGQAAGGRRPKAPPKASAEVLERVALAYLARFAASEAGLRRVLMRRVERAALAGTVDAEVGRAALAGTVDAEVGRAGVEALLARYVRAGLLDDRAFALARAGSLHRHGASVRAIRAKLGQKGIAADLIRVALESLGDAGEGGPDLVAAVNYARRRRLGPFADPARRAARRDRDLAALGRQGFALDIARQVIDASGPDAAEALADQLVREQ